MGPSQLAGKKNKRKQKKEGKSINQALQHGVLFQTYVPCGGERACGGVEKSIALYAGGGASYIASSGRDTGSSSSSASTARLRCARVMLRIQLITSSGSFSGRGRRGRVAPSLCDGPGWGVDGRGVVVTGGVLEVTTRDCE